MMSRPRRKLIIVGVVLLLVAAEIGLDTLREPVACVTVVNDGVAPVERLSISSGRRRAEIAAIAPGESANVYLAGRGRKTLALAFRQQGNALTNFEISDFDPAALHREGFKLVISIQANQVTRYQEHAEPSTLGRLGRNVRDWLARSLDP